MKAEIAILSLLLSGYPWNAIAQDQTQSPQSRPESRGDHGPPPQAYEDCKDKKAGDTVQHTTREGKVAATCEDSPQGRVARPNQLPGARPGQAPSPHGG